MFVPVHAEDSACTEELTICRENWKQATEQPELLAQLVQKEVQEGWVFSVPDLDAARARWGNRVAIGKCNIIGGDELGGQWRKPRLIVDTTVSGTNPSVTIPEKYSLPGVQDVINATPLRGSGTELAGFSLDIRAAHKTVRIHPDEQGLLGFQADNQLWFYRVAPFGGSFSAHWFQRISAFLVRMFHLLLWVQHALWAYVDDFFLVQPSQCDRARGKSPPVLLCCVRSTDQFRQASARKHGPMDWMAVQSAGTGFFRPSRKAAQAPCIMRASS